METRLSNRESARISEDIMERFKNDNLRLEKILGKPISYYEKLSILAEGDINYHSVEEQARILRATLAFINFGRKTRAIKKLSFFTTLNKISEHAIPTIKNPSVQINLEVMFENFLVMDKNYSEKSVTILKSFYKSGMQRFYDDYTLRSQQSYVNMLNIVLDFADDVMRKDNSLLTREYLRKINFLTINFPVV